MNNSLSKFKGSLSKFNCPQCGKNINKILECSKIENKDCFFDVKITDNKKVTYIVSSILLFLFLIIFHLKITILVGLPILFFIVKTFSIQYEIYNKQNDDICYIYKFYDFNAITSIYHNLGEIEVSQSKYNYLKYPPSISLVKDSPPYVPIRKLLKEVVENTKKGIIKNPSDAKQQNNAEEVFLGTIISLISKKEIIVRKMIKDFYFLEKKIDFFSSKIEYIFFPSDNKNNDVPKGKLETKIMKLFDKNDPILKSRNSIYPNIKLLVIWTFDNNETYPDRWLCDLVRKNGAEKNVFDVIDEKRELFQVKPEYEEDLKIEREKIKDMINNLKSYYPAFFNELTKGIKDGLIARETSSD